MVATITSTLGKTPLAVVKGRADEQPLIATSVYMQDQLTRLRVGDKVVCEESWDDATRLIYLGRIAK